MNGAALRLRSARASDLPGIMRLEHAGFDAGICESPEVFAERIAVFSPGFVLAQEADGALAGYITSEVWRDAVDLRPQSFCLGHSIREAHDPHGGALYIASMVVDPARRSAGVGAQLLSACMHSAQAACPTLRSVVLMVNETWGSARALYARHGFVEMARFADFFSPAIGGRQAALILRKELLSVASPVVY